MVCLHTDTMGVHPACILFDGQGYSPPRPGIPPETTPPILHILPLIAHQLASARIFLGWGRGFWLGTFFFDLPWRQDRGSGVALAPSGRPFLEHELGAVGHGGPDAGELVASRFRMEPRPLDGLLQLVAEQLHLLEIQQVGTQHGYQHGMSLAHRLLPGACTDPRWDDLGEGINHRRDLCHAEAGPGAIAHPPRVENQIQGSPEHENGGTSHEHKSSARVMRTEVAGPRGRSWGMDDG